MTQINTGPLQITPGIPDTLRHLVSVIVAHLEPVLLEVTGSGSLPSVVLSLPRAANAAFERCLAEALAEAGLSAKATPSNLPIGSRCACFMINDGRFSALVRPRPAPHKQWHHRDISMVFSVMRHGSVCVSKGVRCAGRHSRQHQMRLRLASRERPLLPARRQTPRDAGRKAKQIANTWS